LVAVLLVICAGGRLHFGDRKATLQQTRGAAAGLFVLDGKP